MNITENNLIKLPFNEMASDGLTHNDVNQFIHKMDCIRANSWKDWSKSQTFNIIPGIIAFPAICVTPFVVGAAGFGTASLPILFLLSSTFLDTAGVLLILGGAFGAAIGMIVGFGIGLGIGLVVCAVALSIIFGVPKIILKGSVLSIVYLIDKIRYQTIDNYKTDHDFNKRKDKIVINGTSAKPAIEVLVGENEIGTLIKVDGSKEALIEKMNFHQLYFVSKKLPEKEFSQLIQSIEKIQHNQWRFILALPKEAKELKELLESKHIKQLLAADHFFKAAVYEKLKTMGNQKMLGDVQPKNELLPIQGNITFKIDDKLVTIQKERLVSKDPSKKSVFDVLVENNFIESSKKIIEIEETGENARLFKKILEFLSQEKVLLDTEALIEILPLVNKYSLTGLLDVMDGYLVSQMGSLDKNELIELVENNPALIQLKKALENEKFN